MDEQNDNFTVVGFCETKSEGIALIEALGASVAHHKLEMRERPATKPAVSSHHFYELGFGTCISQMDKENFRGLIAKLERYHRRVLELEKAE